jgi:hypothetical protein
MSRDKFSKLKDTTTIEMPPELEERIEVKGNFTQDWPVGMIRVTLVVPSTYKNRTTS